MDVTSKYNSSLKKNNKKFNIFTRLVFNSRTIWLSSIFFVVFFILLLIMFRSPNYCILYENLSNEDEKSVVLQLTHMHIPFRFNNNNIVLVPEEDLHRVKVMLYEQGLPKEKNIGFELLDKEKFGISQFNEQINYQRALEGELASSIQKLENIKTARVHIVLPKSSVFIHDKELPTASVILEIKPGFIVNENQVNAILHMLSGSISGLLVDNITIIDQSGRLLSRTNDLYSYCNSMKLKCYDEIENRFKQKIENILIPLVGWNNINVQVTAQIDFNKQELSEEIYSPNYIIGKQVLGLKNSKLNSVSHDKSLVNLNGKKVSSIIDKVHCLSNNVSSNSNSIHSNLPLNFKKQEKNANYINSASLFPRSQTSQDNTVNYKLDHLISNEKLNAGSVKKLAVAIVINYFRDDNGKKVPLSSKAIKEIKELVYTTIGYSEKRGDKVSLINSSFISTEKSLKSSDFIFNWKSIFNYYLLLKFSSIIIILILGLFVLRRLIIYSIFRKKHRSVDNNKLSKNTEISNRNATDIINNKKTFKELLDNISNSKSVKIVAIIKKWINDK